jgi:hypothetical protein
MSAVIKRKASGFVALACGGDVSIGRQKSFIFATIACTDHVVVSPPARLSDKRRQSTLSFQTLLGGYRALQGAR